MARPAAMVAVVLLVTSATVQAQGVDLPPPSVDALDVSQAIVKMVDWLYSVQKAQGHWEVQDRREAYAGHEAEERLTREFGGTTALCTLALLYAGQGPENEKLARAIKWLAEVEMTGTYAVGIRTSVWSKLHDQKYRRLLAKDAAWLLEAMTSANGDVLGSFSYGHSSSGQLGDSSNTQYGVLGLRDAAIRGIEITPKYWLAIQKLMIDTQGADGGWGYQTWIPSPPADHTYGHMTVGGLANLYITLDQLIQHLEGPFNGRSAKGCGMRKPPEAIDKALAWLDKNLPVDFGEKPVDTGTPNPTNRAHGMGGPNAFYYLYGIERCGHASGRKTFGGLNWFEKGAGFILRDLGNQGHLCPYSSIHGPEVTTAWAILFLSKGQAPVFYNKLDTGSDWNNKLRDISNLSAYLGQELEQRVNWQVIDLKDPAETWLDAPVLFFSGHELPKFTDEQKKKLRLYTDSGGTLVAQACCSRDEFTRAFKMLAREVWPEWELQIVDKKHPVLTSQYQILGRTPPMMHINDGCRSSVFLLTQDIAGAWNQNLLLKYEINFQLGMNLARYASDKRMLRSRLAFYTRPVLKELARQGAPHADPPADEAKITVADYPTDGKRLTAIRGLRHLAELLKAADNVAVTRVEFVDGVLDKLDGVQVLRMSGLNTFTVGDADLEKLRAFVKRGGLIVADAQCGRAGFSESFATFVAKLLPGAKLQDVPQSDLVITGAGLPRAGFDLAKARYKRVLKMERFQVALKEVQADGRRAILYSPTDLTVGLDGMDCWGCEGLEQNDSLKLWANIVLSQLAAKTATTTP